MSGSAGTIDYMCLYLSSSAPIYPYTQHLCAPAQRNADTHSDAGAYSASCRRCELHVRADHDIPPP